MKRVEAQAFVERELENNKENSVEVVILENKTIEKDWGWVFFYQSKLFLESSDFRDMLGGNAPIIVNRKTGCLSYTGTAHEINYYIKEYESLL